MGLMFRDKISAVLVDAGFLGLSFPGSQNRECFTLLLLIFVHVSFIIKNNILFVAGYSTDQ